MKPLIIAAAIGVLAGSLVSRPHADPQGPERAAGVGFNAANSSSDFGMQRHSLSELTRSSEAIIIARVEHQRAKKRGGLIWTDCQLRIEDSIKGELKDHVTVCTGGGTVGQDRQVFGQSTRFHDGERVIAFLHRDALGQWRTVAFQQGKLPIHEGKVLGASMPAKGLAVSALKQYITNETEAGR